MNGSWNLDAIYLGYDDPAYIRDMERLQTVVDQYTQYAQDLEAKDPGEALRQCIAMEEEIFVLNNRLNTYSRLRRSTDAKDLVADSEMGKVAGIVNGCAGAKAAMRAWATTLPDLMAVVRGDESLKDYEFLFERMLEGSRYLLPGVAEEVLARMKQSGTSAWTSLQGYMTSTVPVSYRGETLSLSAVRNLARNPDPQVRKDAYEAEIAAYDQIKDAVAYSLNSVKQETLTECALRGYNSPLECSLKNNKLSAETLDAMMGAIEEYLPAFRKYLKAKAKLLGHEGGLPWYDLAAPVGDSSRTYTVEEAKDYLIALFTDFDQQLGDMMTRAFTEDWIDYYPKAGKRGGAFCASVHALAESRVLCNFSGRFAALLTLAHELGHAFHHQCIKTHRPLNRAYGQCLSETASTFNECVLMDYAVKHAKTPEEKLYLLESDLESNTMTICDIFSRFLFERKVFEERDKKFMSADTLGDYMLEAQRVAYGDGLDENYQHPYMWVCKGHYYGGYIFYNYPYAVGGLLSAGLYAKYLQEGPSFVPKYKKFLHTTPVATAEDAAKAADIDLTDKTFWRDALQQIADKIDQFCELVG